MQERLLERLGVLAKCLGESSIEQRLRRKSCGPAEFEKRSL